MMCCGYKAVRLSWQTLIFEGQGISRFQRVLYCITPEFTVPHWLNVYGWRYVVGLLEILTVKQYIFGKSQQCFGLLPGRGADVHRQIGSFCFVLFQYLERAVIRRDLPFSGSGSPSGKFCLDICALLGSISWLVRGGGYCHGTEKYILIKKGILSPQHKADWRENLPGLPVRENGSIRRIRNFQIFRKNGLIPRINL